ncbi:SDR family NAD(P)-dependent oxidoreductase [Promicromonospora citrea]|uniref:Gluconate 5-dehydrogenase n=1 Tax=Promicromonospora citrea TaxID=43677 RepID=A0A8H9GG83_9MICO|nr:SDR family oxidoreductase [Promicromonospora citrea]NNH51399.1 SDR family oxidoreductase [Promicromonospora citrea]GGM23050.1 gluconate 5-dehydrogenase [Promicromonospora citrea]
MTTHDYLASLFSLTGRTAVVTGGSSGIGRAIAEALAQAGARTVLVARGADRLESVAAGLREKGCDVATVVADLSTRAGIHAAADGVVAAAGEPDIVVNSAGINLRPHLGDVDEATWDLTLTVNLEAPFLLGQRFAPGMASRGYGRLIHISSQQAHRSFVDSGVYGVSKGGLESLARSQSEAWSARGVTANTLVPGFVLTPLNQRLQDDADTIAALAARTTVGRNGVPEDFAGAAVFLAGPASGYVTGHSLFVDGGFSVH